MINSMIPHSEHHSSSFAFFWCSLVFLFSLYCSSCCTWGQEKEEAKTTLKSLWFDAHQYMLHVFPFACYFFFSLSLSSCRKHSLILLFLLSLLCSPCDSDARLPVSNTTALFWRLTVVTQFVIIPFWLSAPGSPFLFPLLLLLFFLLFQVVRRRFWNRQEQHSRGSESGSQCV